MKGPNATKKNVYGPTGSASSFTTGVGLHFLWLLVGATVRAVVRPTHRKERDVWAPRLYGCTTCFTTGDFEE